MKRTLPFLFLFIAREGLERLRKTGEHTFRRIRRDDGELAEEIVFTVADGKVTRFTRHNNHVLRVN